MISGLFQTIAELVGEWYFERGPGIEIDCAYPCDSTCHNIIPSNQVCSILEEFFFLTQKYSIVSCTISK